MSEANRLSWRLLMARQVFGISTPRTYEGLYEWLYRMEQYQEGLRVLERDMGTPGFTASGVSEELRSMLQHPLLDRPATDDDVEMLVALIRQRDEPESEANGEGGDRSGHDDKAIKNRLLSR